MGVEIQTNKDPSLQGQKTAKRIIESVKFTVKITKIGSKYFLFQEQSIGFLMFELNLKKDPSLSGLKTAKQVIII